MQALAFSEMFVVPQRAGPLGARVRFGRAAVQRLKRRRWPRRTRLDVRVLTMSGGHNAVLRALTLYGATLTSKTRLRRRELVALRLSSGRRVKARVCWRFGDRCGVTFLTPVADFARLLHESRSTHTLSAPRRPCTGSAQPDFRHGDLAQQVSRTVTRAQRLSRQVLRWCRSL